jgi:hypothetical protein
MLESVVNTGIFCAFCLLLATMRRYQDLARDHRRRLDEGRVLELVNKGRRAESGDVEPNGALDAKWRRDPQADAEAVLRPAMKRHGTRFKTLPAFELGADPYYVKLNQTSRSRRQETA